MRALVLGPEGPRLQHQPFVPRPGEATVRVRVAGVCATDLELVKGYMGFRGVLGHEWVGVVEDAPDAAWVGARVVGDINVACGRCPTCLAGRRSHCPSRSVLGIAGRDGAFAERLSLPIENLHRVPEGVADEAAVFVEPLAAALRILEQVHITPSMRVVVLGPGRLGQLCARVIAGTGARVQAEGRAERLARLPAGIDRGAEPGADVVVDCTGTATGLARAVELVRPLGTIVLKTTVHDLGDVNPTQLVLNEVVVVGSRCGPLEQALHLLASGAVAPTPLIDAALDLADDVLARARGARKVLVRP